ncbi:RNA-directed DNA polymerase, eukaryota [Tanacetum coccineum]
MGSKDLWRLCEKQGTVTDVYIARKLSKIGRRFAFVRYLKVKNSGSLMEALNKIWIGSYHLFAAMARFDRKPTVTHKSTPKFPNNQHKTASFSSHANPNRSYATDLNGKASQNLESNDRVILKSVTLDVTDLLDTSDMRNVILAKVRDVHLILNINNVLKKEGFYGFQCKYIGGMWLWIEFDSLETCQKLQSNKEMSWYFILMKHVTQTFKADERVIWIEIGGLPLNAWTTKAYKKIAGSWGEPLFVDEDPHDNVAMGREFARWVPDIKDMESMSCKNSKADNSDNHDHDDNDCGFHDVEEGEIPKTNVSQEEEVVMNTQWSVDAEQNEKDHVDSPINLENHKQPSKETSEKQKEDSESISKPPGFEGYKNNNSQNSKQPSMSSFAAAKTSRVSKSHSKSLNSHGSMIDAFISHIEMGNVLGYDMEDKCKAIAKLCDKHKVAFLGIQEMHSLKIDPFKNLLIVEDDRKKEMLWHNILDYMECNPDHYFIFGDFNVVRHASERIGIIFNPSSANVFNQFIHDGHLWDVPLGGHLFTRVNNRGDKLSKLDRFLITENTTSLLHNYSAQVLDCHISDHRPIFLSPSASDFGPTPFKFYNSWLTDKHLHDIVVEFWEQHDTEISPNPIVRFRKKMKALKPFIREWSKNRSSSQSRDKEELIKKIKEFDDINARRTGDIVLGSQRITWLTDLRSIESNENLDYSQKAKIKWGIEAGENSKFFHATVNQKRRYLSIHWIKHEGQWLSEPYKIKDAFYSFLNLNFKEWMCETEIRDAIWDCGSDKSPGLDGFTFAFYKKFWDTLKEDVVGFDQELFSTGTLPRGCNALFIALIPKVPNPMVISDFCPISLIRAQYKIIAKVLANRLAQVIDSVIGQEQFAFIKNRQILDGPLMVSEAIQWCKRKKTKLIVFKIDFEKAFDSISWDFLLQVMRFLGFNDTWIKWISGCLFSATSSILINGSPTHEFNINRGLRQGDPLSPFLFIIAMEGLHVALEDVIAAGLYRCLKANGRVITSQVWFLSWNVSIGYLASKLTITNLISLVLEFLSLITGCNAMQTPFSYLGLPIDCNMANVKSWDPIVDKFSKRLSKWKSSMLSIGGRDTLISSVLGSIGTYYLSLFSMPITVSKKLESIRSHFFWGSDDSSKRITWISWNLVLASKGNGGLGIGSLYSLNQALIQK